MYKTLQDFVGNTPLVRLVRIPGADNDRRGNLILAKLEGNNPAGSVKDRPALSMISRASTISSVISSNATTRKPIPLLRTG